MLAEPKTRFCNSVVIVVVVVALLVVADHTLVVITLNVVLRLMEQRP